jgi:esterase/lipase superfamily enzyme
MSDIRTLLAKLPASVSLSGGLHVPRVPGCRRVWYCTNRAVHDPTAFDLARFSGELGSCEYGLCQVHADPNRPAGEMTRAVGIPYLYFGRQEKTIKLRSSQQFDLLDMCLKLLQAHETTRRRSSLLFVHGYNMNFVGAIERAAQLAEDLHISGEVFAFSWPSQGSTAGYVADQDRADKSVDSLSDWANLILAAMENWGDHLLHIVAHSMGNRVFAPAVVRLQNPNHRIGELILAAADLDIDRMEESLGTIVTCAERVSIYASTTDRALALSERLHMTPRFGASPPSSALWDVIHCDGSGKDFWKHSYAFETPSVLRDMESTLQGREYSERNLVSTGKAGSWRLMTK